MGKQNIRNNKMLQNKRLIFDCSLSENIILEHVYFLFGESLKQLRINLGNRYLLLCVQNNVIYIHNFKTKNIETEITNNNLL